MKPIPHHEPRRAALRLALLSCAASAFALPAQAQEGKPVKGGTVIAALNATTIPTLNTQLTSNVPPLFAADVWADGLMTYDRKGTRLPRLATKWETSADGRTYTFTLRSGVKWSDGKPFSAEDVVFTLTTFGKYNTYLTKLMPLVEEASAPNPTTFVLRLKAPLTATLDLFAQDAAYTVTLATPSLTNTASGTIATVAGVGGVRVLNATLINQGTVNIPFDLAITGASAAHVNSGTITLTTGDLTVTQSGTTPSFTNTGTIAAGARTLTFAGGTVDLTAGSVSGVGALVSTTGTTALLLAPAQVQPRLNLSAATTIPMALTIGATDSLRVRGTFAPTTLTNNGSLLLEGTTTVNTALTSGVGSSILVRGITASGAANVTFANGFTNNGLFRIIAQDAAYAVAANFGANTLTNAANGTIDLALGSNGSRTLTAALVDNSGAFTANFNGTVTGAIAQRGTLTVAATRSLTVSGLTTLFAGSTTTATGGTLTLTGGCSNQGGTFTGFTCP